MLSRRGRIRRAGLFVGSAALVAVLAVGGYAGAGALSGRSQLQPADSNVLIAAAETTVLEDTARTAFVMDVSYDMAGATSGHAFEGTGELSFVDDMSHMVMQLDGESEPQLAAGDHPGRARRLHEGLIERWMVEGSAGCVGHAPLSEAVRCGPRNFSTISAGLPG